MPGSVQSPDRSLMNPDDDPYAEPEDNLRQVARNNPLLAVGAVLVFVLAVLCIIGAFVGAFYFFSSGNRVFPILPTPTAQTQMQPDSRPAVQMAQQYALVNPQNNPGMILKTFSFDQAEGWVTGKTESAGAGGVKRVADGQYTWDLQAQQPVNEQSYLLNFEPGVSASGYQLSVTARLAEGPADALFGLCFHYQNTDRYWQFLMDESGRAFVAAHAGGQWGFPGEILLADAPVRAGADNTLTIQVTASSAVFFVNGYQVGALAAGQHQEDSLLTGSFGLAADIARAGDHIVLHFDDFSVSTPPGLGQ